MANSAKTLAHGAVHISRRIVASYVLDWILIIGIAAIGGSFYSIKSSNKRPFNLADPSISYPLNPDTVTTKDLLLAALLAPALITLLVSLLCIPGPTAHPSTPRALIWRRKLWEWNTAWMGLCLSLASAFMITEGLKDLAGKPRPHAIAVCNPDLSAESIARNTVGGLGVKTLADITGVGPVIVAASICRNTDATQLRDAFASWPSGHSSFSFAGLLYLTLFLCAKFAVHAPRIVTSGVKSDVWNTYDFDTELRRPRPASSSSSAGEEHKFKDKDAQDASNVGGGGIPPRNAAAAAPVYLLVLAVFVPVGTATFICVSRWFDFHHHGIDIFSGALIGAFSAWFAFRYYHMPIRSGSGWAWGARSRGRAFWVGVGRDGYVGDEGWMHAAATGRSSTTTTMTNGAGGGNADRDLEAAREKTEGDEGQQPQQQHVMGPGLDDRGDVSSAQTQTQGQGQVIRGNAQS